MKILYHHRIRSKDGQYVHLEELVAALRAMGHEVRIVGPEAVGNAAFGSDAGLVAWMKRRIPKALYEIIELGYGVFAYLRLARAIRAFRPDGIYERYNLFLPSGVWAKRRFGLPLLLEVNSPLYAERKRFDGIALDALARWSERTAWRGADAVLPVTEALAELVTRETGSQQRISVIPNGINTEHFSAALDCDAVRKRWKLEDRLVLGFTGFVREWHGLDRVIASLAADAPERRRMLIVVGDGPARAGLQAQARSLGISERVVFTGVVAREDVPAHVACFDIALQPAVVAYASPLKLFEYLALGRAIVAPLQPNICEVLTDNVNALLFDPAVPDALAAAIDRLSDDAALRKRLAAGARNTIGERGLTWARNAERVTALFESLVTRAHASAVAGVERDHASLAADACVMRLARQSAEHSDGAQRGVEQGVPGIRKSA